jgi:hypothetical protein
MGSSFISSTNLVITGIPQAATIRPSIVLPFCATDLASFSEYLTQFFQLHSNLCSFFVFVTVLYFSRPNVMTTEKYEGYEIRNMKRNKRCGERSDFMI